MTLDPTEEVCQDLQVSDTVNNTEITYLYRDPANWKFWGTFVVEGKLSLTALQPYLIRSPHMPADVEWFKPQLVGLKHLLTEPWDHEDDDMHELHEFAPTERQDILCTADELVLRFSSASRRKWNEY